MNYTSVHGCDICFLSIYTDKEKLRIIKEFKDKNITIYKCPSCKSYWELNSGNRRLIQKFEVKEVYNIKTRIKINSYLKLFLYFLYVLVFLYVYSKIPGLSLLIFLIGIIYSFIENSKK